MGHNFEFDALRVLGFLLVVATAPLLLELLVLTSAAILPARNRLEMEIRPLGRLVILVPCHNEELHISRCVESISASAGGIDDVLVIAHNCRDQTAERAREIGAFVCTLDDPDLPGKGNALAYGFGVAFRELGADAVLVIDADSVVGSDVVARVRQRLSCALAVQCRYECRSTPDDPRSVLRAFAFFCINVVRPMGRQHLRLSCGIFGNGFALRREVFDAVPYAAHSIVEDLEFHLSLVAAGIRCEFIEKARIWADVPLSIPGAITQSTRWEGGRMRMLRSRGPSLLLQVLRGYGSLIEPLIDLAGLPLALEMSSLLLILSLPIHTLRVYASLGVAIIVFHLLVAIRLGSAPTAKLRALVYAPLYIISKLAMLPGILKMTSNRAVWVRTSRTSTSKADPSSRSK